MSRSTRGLPPKTLMVLAMFIAATTLEASDLFLTFANDPVTANRRPDDLYTSDFTLDLRLNHARVVAGERMFTDRDAGLRFDETHLSVHVPVVAAAGWNLIAGIGGLRVGRGLLGEGVQNQLHRLLAMDEVRLSYIDGDHAFLTLAASASRDLGDFRGASLEVRVEAYAAPDYRSWLVGEVSAVKPIRSLEISGAIRARLDAVENIWLDPHISGAGLSARFGLEWQSLFIRWSFNEYGTNTPHVSLGIRTTFSKTHLTSASPIQVNY